MTEPNWTDTDAVRNWLGSRYPIASVRTGSPFFQYLKDEQAKGNKIRGREKHLSGGPGGEFRRWVFNDSECSAFYYPADSMRATYYPEYIDQSSQSRSQSPTYDEDTTRHKASNFPSGYHTDYANSKEYAKPAKPKPQKTKPARKSRNVESLVPASANPKSTKKSGRKPLASVSKRETVKQIDSKLLRLQEVRVSTLRPGRDRKRPKTDFFHPDDHTRVQK